MTLTPSARSLRGFIARGPCIPLGCGSVWVSPGCAFRRFSKCRHVSSWWTCSPEGGDRDNAGDRDPACEQHVLDEVPALFVPNRAVEQILHGWTFQAEITNQLPSPVRRRP